MNVISSLKCNAKASFTLNYNLHWNSTKFIWNRTFEPVSLFQIDIKTYSQWLLHGFSNWNEIQEMYFLKAEIFQCGIIVWYNAERWSQIKESVSGSCAKVFTTGMHLTTTKGCNKDNLWETLWQVWVWNNRGEKCGSHDTVQIAMEGLVQGKRKDKLIGFWVYHQDWKHMLDHIWPF